MEIIPVIDVKGGVAVHAVAGDRARYRPLETPLAPGTSDPASVAHGYRQLYPFPTLYIADLDAIERGCANSQAVAAIATAWQGEIWLDAGAITTAENPMPSAPRTVIGSESLLAAEACRMLGPGGAMDPNAVLSLDFRGDAFIGPPALLTSSEHWPGRVIVMTLARVGAGGGPDLARVAQIIRAAGAARKVYAAGGVRGPDDLAALGDLGAAGALVATALHTGALTRQAISAAHLPA